MDFKYSSILKNCVISALLAAAVAFIIRPPHSADQTQAYFEHSSALPMYSLTGEASPSRAEPDPSASPTAAPSAAPEGFAELPLVSSTVSVSIDGKISVMELEEYLIGVVAAEMPASSEPAALQAQAVAARTFTALHMAGGAKCTHGAEGCTVCSDPSCCQAYKSPQELRAAWGNKYDDYIERITRAVRATSGVVVTYNGKLINALYHASSGRATENSEAVFAMALPYLVSVDSFEGESEMISVQQFNEAVFAAIINEAHPDAHLIPPLSQGDVDVWGRTESGRVQLVQLGETVIDGQRLRRLLGLKSTAFTVEIANGCVSFTCEGYGHGVGMSQYGANAMAKEGYEYDEILYHYYTGTELATLTYAFGS